MYENTSGYPVMPPSEAAAPSLSDQLRAGTSSLHRQIEALLGLPGAVVTLGDYVAWLSRFFGLYEPLEHLLEVFPEWRRLDFALSSRSHTACLTDDLAALGIDARSLPRMSPALLPDLPTFAHALGALYVLEGATLGGRVILRDLDARLGTSIAGATRFFGGRREAVGPMWLRFRALLDDFGRERPELHADVTAGAQHVFRAMLVWFAPFCAVAAGRP